MFDSRRLLGFAGKILWAAVPSLVVVLVLSFFVQILAWLRSLPGAVSWWEDLPRVLLTGQFWLRLSLGIVPLLLAIGSAFLLAARFLKAVYPNLRKREAILFILYSRFSRPMFGPWIKIQGGKISGKEDSVLIRIGGPGTLIVGPDNAVVLERGGVFTSVQGPGFPKLEAFEKVYDIIDLGPKSYCHAVTAMSREGILLDWDVDVQYQVADGRKSVDKGAFYPLSPEDVFRASTAKWIREDGWKFGQDMDWEGLLVISRAEGTLRSILARRPLDQLIGPDEGESQEARLAIQSELEQDLRIYAPTVGARILRVRLDNLKVRDEVTKQWIETWKAKWQSWSAERLAQAEAKGIFHFEKVKAEAQAEMVLEISQALRKGLRNEPFPPQAVSQMLLLRLFSVLDRADFAASSRVFFPRQTLQALESIRRPIQESSQFTVSALIADPSSVAAQGSTTILAIIDGAGIPVPDGTEVAFGARGNGFLSPHKAGTTNSIAQTTLTAETNAGDVQVWARVAGAAATMTVRVVPGPPAAVTLLANPPSTEIGGEIELFAEVRDAFDNPVADGTPVLFQSALSRLSPASAETSQGRVQSRLTASNKVGQEQVWVQVGQASAAGQVTILPGVPYRLTLLPDSYTLEVGCDARIVATVVDARDNQVADGTMVAFRPSRGSASPALAGTVDGQASTVLPSGLTPGPIKVTASAGQASDSVSLEVVPGPPNSVVLVCSAESTHPHGQVTLSAIVADAQGNAVAAGIPVVFEADPGETDPPVTHTSGGVAHSRFVAGPLSGTVKLTVRAGACEFSRTLLVT